MQIGNAVVGHSARSTRHEADILRARLRKLTHRPATMRFMKATFALSIWETKPTLAETVFQAKTKMSARSSVHNNHISAPQRARDTGVIFCDLA